MNLATKHIPGTTVVYFAIETIDPGPHIGFIQSVLHPEHIIIYHTGSGSWLKCFACACNITIAQLPDSGPTVKLKIFADLLGQEKNLISFNHCYYEIGCLTPYLVYALFGTLGDKPIYDAIGEKFKIKCIISSDALVVPYTVSNYTYLRTALDLGSQLQTRDIEILTNLSLTIANIQLKTCVKNLADVKKPDRCITEPHILFVPYNDPAYLFYPYMDLGCQKMPVSQPLPDIFNTNGDSFCQTNRRLVQPLLFQRFCLGTSGIFFRKEYKKLVVPKILHQIWFGTPVPNLVFQWKKSLREPWTYRLWTGAELENDIFFQDNLPTRWKILFDAAIEPGIQFFIASMAILERYGGLVVDEFMFPARPIPDEILMHDFWMTFSLGTKLNYSMVTAAPINSVIDIIYQTLSSNHNTQTIDTTIITCPDAIIYPNYYSGLEINIPKKLLQLAICYRIHPKPIEPVPIGIVTNNIVSEQTQNIIARLEENPRDRIKL